MATDSSLISPSAKCAFRASGYGEGYCYAGGVRSVVVVASSEWLARACCVGEKMKLRAVRGYPANPARQVFVFQRRAGGAR